MIKLFGSWHDWINDMPWIDPWAPRIYRGELYDTELRLIVHFARQLKAKRILEIGTHRGRTALALAQNTKAQVYTLDIKKAPEDVIEKDLEFILPIERVGFIYREVDCPGITQLWGDSREFDFTPYYGKIGAVLVDGSHAYETVKHDLSEAAKMVKPGGIVFCHDYFSWAAGCRQAIDEFAEDREDAVLFLGTILVGVGDPMRGVE
ncbi:MAG: class I SAM-dependent methyltransferase [Proteobacteria bacterium]|nr:class I SAM-dependent methyltransferase [Pseudomonadota bacterium]